MHHVVLFSGGIGSFYAALRTTEAYGKENTTLVFTDTLTEDEDLYRFLTESAEHIGSELVWLKEGRDIWQVFFDKRYLGNSRVDPCSRILKRELAREYVENNWEPDEVTVVLGIDWTEEHRLKNAKRYWEPYSVVAPMCDKPYIDKDQMIEDLSEFGIKPPRLYEMGFPHNNCGGFCVKAGFKHFKLLLQKMPERYAYHEQKEEELRKYLDKDVSILRDRRKGHPVTPLTLKDFRKRVMEKGEIDEDDWGGCGCFTPNEYLDETEVRLETKWHTK